jgi:hypothetical protein
MEEHQGPYPNPTGAEYTRYHCDGVAVATRQRFFAPSCMRPKATMPPRRCRKADLFNHQLLRRTWTPHSILVTSERSKILRCLMARGHWLRPAAAGSGIYTTRIPQPASLREINLYVRAPNNCPPSSATPAAAAAAAAAPVVAASAPHAWPSSNAFEPAASQVEAVQA